jgi:hypothetical protein
MAHDGTNHPWYQGFSNIFGSINQGFQNAMQSPTQNVTRPEFIQDWIRQQGTISENGFFDTQGFMSTNDAGEQIFDPIKFRDAYMDGDRNAAMAMVLGEEAYKESKLQDKGKMNELMNNPAFMMGLNLMGQAGQGKSIQEALAPSMTATQAFMTNQELRKQNKRLSMNKDGTISEALDAAVDRKSSMKINAATAQITETKAKYFETTTKANIKNLDLNNNLQEVALNIAKATEGDQIQLVKGKVDLMAKELTAAELNNQKMTEFLSVYPDMLQAELTGALLTNKNTDERTKGLILDHQAQRIQNQQAELELEISQADYGEVEAYRKWIKSQNFSEKKEAILIANGPNGFTAIDNKEDINNYRDAYEKYGSSIETSIGKYLTTSGEGLEQEKTQLKETIISTAVKLADGKEPTQQDFKEAEELVFSKWGIKKNNWIARFFNDEEYRMTIFSGKKEGMAMGGPVQAGRTYTVGEDGPETFVPKQDGNIVSNPRTPGGFTWEDAIIDSSPMLKKIKDQSGIAEAKKALRKFRPDLYV